MSRLLTLAAVAILLAAPAARADGPGGLWKFRFADGNDTPVTFLMSFVETDGKWVGDFIGSSVRLKLEPKFTNLAVNGDNVKFALAFGGREFINFDGMLAKDGKKLTGSYSQFGGRLRLTDLYPSKLKKLADPFDLARETAAQLESGAELFDAGFEVAENAAAKKVPVEEVRGLADKLAKASAGYGPRWEQSVALRLAGSLANQDGFADVALAQARRVERMLGDDAPAAVALEVTEILARVLTRADKAEEAKKYIALAAKLEAKDYAEYQKAAGFAPMAFAGRKAKSDRVVLMELFTGAECPPCAGVDLAADGLLKTFQPTDVILLQYHFHVPQPDPLTSPDGMSRVETYGDQVRAAPTVFLNGKPGPEGGGPAAAAKDKYAELREAIDPLLEKPAAVKLALAVTKGEKGYTAKATVSDLEAPGEKVKLRFALAEERVRYTGGNGIRYHHNVVRAMPGGAKGIALTKKSEEQTVEFDLAAVRAKLSTYLDDFAKNEGPFPRADRPMALKGLKLIAFVQNDATGEVLQAVQTDVDGK